VRSPCTLSLEVLRTTTVAVAGSNVTRPTSHQHVNYLVLYDALMHLSDPHMALANAQSLQKPQASLRAATAGNAPLAVLEISTGHMAAAIAQCLQGGGAYKGSA
jgi:hypothetical protein